MPDSYEAFVRDRTGVSVPAHMTDGGREPWGAPFDRRYDPDSPLDIAIMATREAVFPHWGLVADPYGGF